ncbi:MAG: hypothetical protein IJP38_06275 [Oscillospiraceae bacterium]|nr:hypothetical protein [Oscillospiraceae bacterium]
MQNNKSIYITVLSVALIAFGMFGSLLLEEALANRIVGIITACTAIVGAVSLFYQFKRDKNLNEASFLVDYSQQFYEIYDCADLMNELEKCRIDPDYVLDTEKYYQKIVGYLEWLETLGALVNSNLLSISKIDDVLSYRYFLIVNNKQIQDCELITNREFYRGIYKMYPSWERYKKDRKRIVVLEETSLSKTEGFADIAYQK